MMMQSSYKRVPVPSADSTAILKLMAHTRSPVGRTSAPVKAQPNQWHGREHVDASLNHHVTPAECYGCVDWFPY
jgi:hypothetical protein